MYVFAFMQLGAWMVILYTKATTSLNHCFLHHMFFTTGGATEQVYTSGSLSCLYCAKYKQQYIAADFKLFH